MGKRVISHFTHKPLLGLLRYDVIKHFFIFLENRTEKFSEAKSWTVILGEHKLKEEESFEQSRKVEKYILHPKYEFLVFVGIYDVPPDYDIGEMRIYGYKGNVG
jgi:hypothetical protein